MITRVTLKRGKERLGRPITEGVYLVVLDYLNIVAPFHPETHTAVGCAKVDAYDGTCGVVGRIVNKIN
jgi:hypothetical protein